MKRYLALAPLLVLLAVSAHAATGSGNNFTTTTNMHLLLPIPGVTGGLGVEPPGFSHMELTNKSLTTIDQHNHSPGNGAPVPTSGLNINADLPLNSFNATLVRAIRLNNQNSTLAAPGDIRAIYSVGGDLYYNNAAGTAIQITSGSGVAGTPGSIGGLASPASATYTAGSGTFTFQSNTNVAATLDSGPHVIRDTAASAFGITLKSPVSLAGAYSLTLPPALPGSTSLLSVTTAGALNTVTYPLAAASIANGTLTTTQLSASAGITGSQLAASAGITRGQLAAVGQQVSASSGAFSSSTNAWVAVTNLSVTITTTGRPVMLIVQPDGSLPASIGAAGAAVDVRFLRGGSSIGEAILSNTTGQTVGYFSVGPMLDAIGAGTYTYSVQIHPNGATAVNFQNVVLAAYEL